MADQGKGPNDEGRGRDRPGSEATTHLAYREWANEALGDERQVYARSTAGEGGELVFMPEGAAEQFRAAAQAGRLVCPVPGCPSPRLTTRGPADRRHHFVRRQAEVQAFDGARGAAEAQLWRRLAQARAHDASRGRSVLPAPVRGPAEGALDEGARDWPCDPDSSRRLLGDADLARRVEQPLGTDVECDVPPAIWHLMAVLELRRRGGEAHPLAIRAAIVTSCGYRLAGEAIAGVLAVARDSS